MNSKPDLINRPLHYNSHPSGIECIEITEHFNFCVGNAIKYLWRAGLKGSSYNSEIEDLKKARWYIDREISRLEKSNTNKILDDIRVMAKELCTSKPKPFVHIEEVPQKHTDEIEPTKPDPIDYLGNITLGPIEFYCNWVDDDTDSKSKSTENKSIGF